MSATHKEDLYANLPEPDPDYLNDDDDGSQGNHPAADTDDFPPPPPPLTAEELATAVSEAYEAQVQNGISPTAADGSSSGQAQQIKGRPLHNPCVESRERQALHRELLLNYKIGKDVLQKPELSKVLRERRETQRKKEWEQQKSGKGRTSLELKLQERRTREEEEAKLNLIKEEERSATPELLRIHKKITHKSGGSGSADS